MKILLIEDDTLIRNCFQTYLERKGHTVFTYTRGEGAIDYALKMRPDLVLTDHNLEPEGPTGVEIAYRLIQEGQRVVLMSGDPSVRMKAAPLDITFVEKISVRDVLEEVERYA